ncbi:50S ribosomal protein L1 [Decorospora gaudefroyi]|uniref:50S ribosomal protein L1 n=1 Tax=Decorospora gaudefroyi TaxID=184978 RepID=A0A6A5KIK8_9PLEO|nr:50S ribosomal protein L1 [Decorospora gaudefroyi]
MAHTRPLTACLSRLTKSSIAASRLEAPRFAAIPYQTKRCAATKAQPQEKKKKSRNTFLQYDLKRADQFALLDAMRYIRAFEVGRMPTSSKYELHVRIRTLKNGPIIRGFGQLPHPFKTDVRVCVFAAPGSAAAAEAWAAGAALVGEDEIFDQIKQDVIEFDRCICHIDSFPKMIKARLERKLGPRSLLPNAKQKTVVTQVGPSVKSLLGGSGYKERDGVIHMAVGHLGFTPEELQTNVKAFMLWVQRDMRKLGDKLRKEVHEVVLSSTNAPGFSLTGEYRGANSIAPKELRGPL